MTMTVTKQQIVSRDKTHILPDGPSSGFQNLYGYKAALAAAGATPLAYEQFGSYQGSWWAECELPNGEIVYVNGGFGSCSGCDAFEAEFGWDDEKKSDYPERLRDFGRDYLTNCYTISEAIEKASENLDRDFNAQEEVDWLKSRPVPRDLD